jgi:hypothetical protein
MQPNCDNPRPGADDWRRLQSSRLSRRSSGWQIDMVNSTERTGLWDRQLLGVIVASAIVLVTRAAIIAHFHGPTRDENYHLYRGLILLRHDSARIHDKLTKWNDPLLGDAILAIPAWLNGVHMLDPVLARDPERTVPPPPENQYIMPDSLRIETAI